MYSHSEISEMVTLTDDRRTLDIVVSNTEATFAPTFKFHSTAAMNFVGWSHPLWLSAADLAVPFNGQHGGHILRNVWSG